jgi:RNA polymerase sigma-70 factor (ECF subfamily)
MPANATLAAPSPMPALSTTAEFLAHLENHQRILYKVAYAYCRDRDDRQDLIQEMLIQVWRSFERFDHRVKFSTWMYRIAVNVAISYYRREKRPVHDTLPIEEHILDTAAADQWFDDAGGNMRTLRKLIDALDEMNRALLLLFLEGFNSEEIAEVVGISASNVTTRINRLKTRLQAEFEAINEGAIK